jgi:hypothetical protein
MIDMVRRHEIQVLRRAGHSMVETAKLVGVSQSSVQRVEAEGAVSSFDTATERSKRQLGGPSKAEPFRSFLVAELACNLTCSQWSFCGARRTRATRVPRARCTHS